MLFSELIGLFNRKLPQKFLSLISSCNVYNLVINQREIKKGDLFFAYKGHVIDSRNYIDEAIVRGATAVICEASEKRDDCKLFFKYSNVLKKKIPVIKFYNLKKKIGLIASIFFGFPSRYLSIIGITGTNGKTSCSFFVSKLLNLQHQKCGIIGTLGMGFHENLISTKNTTPDPITLQKQLNAFWRSNAKFVVAEVSSHGIDQNRIAGINFSGAVFTNLTQDHLDYHKNINRYFESKKKFFLKKELKFCVINVDDFFGKKLFKILKNKNELKENKLKIYTYGLNEKANIYAKNIELKLTQISANIFINNVKRGNLKSNLAGIFNLYNLLAAIGCLLALNFKLSDILTKIPLLTTVPGRMQILGGVNNLPTVIIDYAHTPDALEQILLLLRKICKKKIVCVFGCGGNRDKIKRPIMGKIVERYCDVAIITNDNPRNENQCDIINDIIQGVQNKDNILIKLDRCQAIENAIKIANADDIILIAGKGHEQYQIINDEKIPFSDVEIVKKELKIHE